MGESNAYKVIVRIIVVILVLALIMGLAYFIIRVLRKENGMYVRFNGSYISSSNSGINIDIYGDNIFQICDDSDFGSYSVTSASVSVLCNVKAGSTRDFLYSVGTEEYMFSDVEDYSSIFAEDGESITVDEDGYFDLRLQKSLLMEDYLCLYYGFAVSLEDSLSLEDYPYFYLHIVSPDEEEILDISFSLYIGNIPLEGVELYPGEVVFR